MSQGTHTSKLAGKVAIVTGGGRGIGEQTVLKLAAEGARVVVNELDADACHRVVEQVRSQGGEALAVPGDLTAQHTPDDLVAAAVNEFGRLDIVVNNAGYIWNSAMHKHSDEQWDAMLQMHATAPFRLLRACYPVFKQLVADEGQAVCRKVVNISSISGTQGSPTQIAYATGKAAVVGLTKTLAKEWGYLNVCVNCVAFGPIETRLTQTYADEPPRIDVDGKQLRVGLHRSQVDDLQTTVPLQRMGSAVDAAGAIYLLCIPESDYITGQVLTCSGGL